MNASVKDKMGKHGYWGIIECIYSSDFLRWYNDY